jgi:2-dehydropantoate 2-reductase
VRDWNGQAGRMLHMDGPKIVAPKVVIQGAGLIGGYLGGVLAHAGADVTLLGRPAFLDAIRRDGLRLTDLHGLDIVVDADRLHPTTDAACLSQADIILVCVKSGATQAAALDIVSCAKPHAVIVSFQNGVSNAEVLRASLAAHTVIPGMVPFNVMQPAPNHWHRGTDGALYAAPHPALDFLVPLFAGTKIQLKFHDEMASVLWSKILMNLNNAVNALSGIPLRAQLRNRNYRLVLAACIAEALQALDAAHIIPAQINRTKPQDLPKILRWPNFLYNLLAMRQLKIDGKARSSMAADLALGRKTEIDDINGAVERLGKAHGVKTPVNARIIQLVRRAEAGDTKRYAATDLRGTVLQR